MKKKVKSVSTKKAQAKLERAINAIKKALDLIFDVSKSLMHIEQKKKNK